MATADELLSGVSSVDNTFVIDSDLRTIRIPSNVTNLGVESDDEVLRIKFRMPSEYCGIDLSTFKIRINYLNAIGEGDVYDVTDVTKLNGTMLAFSWLVGRHATAYKGDLKFNVCMKDVASDGTVLREFNTTIASKPVLEGLEVAEQAIAEYTDIFEQWRSMLFGVGDTEEQRLIDTSTEQQENIVEKGAEVLASIPKDYTTTYNNAEEAVRTKADAIVQSAAGEVITVNDSSDDYLRGLHVFGKTVQVTTTGAQIFNAKDCSGVGSNNTISVSDDEYTIVATGGVSAGYAFSKFTLDARKCIGKTLIMTVDNLTGAPQCGVMLYGLINGSSSVNYTLRPGDRYIECPIAENIDEVKVYVYTNTTGTALASANTVIVRGLMVSYAACAWEPYSGGVASPSPEWPQELENSGVNNGVIKTELYGKNLFDYNDTVKSTYSGVVLNATLDHGVITMSGTSMVGYGTLKTALPLGAFKKGQTYRISRVSKNFHAGFWFYDENNVNLGSLTTENSAPITIPENADHMSLFYAGLTPGTNVHLTEKFMLNLGTEALPWEPSVESQSVVYTCPNGLPGIPVTSGGNYTDSNGQQWICDEVDFERGLYVRRIHTLVCDGTETVTREERYGGTYRFNIVPATLVKADPYPGGYFSHFVYDIDGPIGNNDIDRSFCMWTNGRIYGRYDDITSAEDMSAWIVSQYENGTPFIAQYVLATPVETPLTTEEIAAFRTLKTNYPSTVTLNDAGAGMKLKYNADIETWIKNLIRNSGGGGGSSARISNVTLLASKWVGSSSPYSQVVQIDGVTENSQVDLTPSIDQLAVFRDKDLAFVTENDGGMVTVYALGDKPANDYTIQVTITEVYV